MADVVIVTHNSARHARGAVEEFRGDPRFHVVVVDNGSTDGTAEAMNELGIEVVEQENLGFAHGCNTGWRAGNAPAVLFLNPDARISVESVEVLLASLEDDAVGV